MKNYDLVVIGAGPGGYVAAIKAAQLGLSVAVVEKNALGGTCLNCGCMPTKTLLHSAELYQQIKHATAFGIQVTDAHYDYPKMHQRQEEVISGLRNGIEQLLSANKIDLYPNQATILDGHRVGLSGLENQEISGTHLLLATGSKPIKPNIAGIDLEHVVTSEELLAKNDAPYERLVIIGGGVIGLEFAGIYQALGAQVTIIEAMPRILPTMDREIAQNLSMILKKDGVKIQTEATVQSISQDEGLVVTYQSKDQVQSVVADGVLVAVGRCANTQGLFAPDFEVAMEKGRILVNEQFCTSVDSIYAIGDVCSQIQLAHLAQAQGTVVAEQLAGHQPSINLQVVPACIYTSPEIATVGLTHDEAKAQGRSVKVGKFLMTANGKTQIEQGKRGFIKLVFDQESEILLGAQLMCARATDLIGELTTAVALGLNRSQLASVIHAHPTFSEGIACAIEDAGGGSVHTLPRR